MVWHSFDTITNIRMNKHPESALEATDLGKRFPAYKPTFAFPGEYIDNFHTLIASSAKGAGLIKLDESFAIPVKGWLRRADALKLYEMGYFAAGDILELGSYHGLSTCILSQANHNTGGKKHIYSVDLSAENSSKTMESLRATCLNRHVETICSEATAAIQRFMKNGRSFAFVFVDHSHSYKPVYDVCTLLPKIVSPGGFCLFHDFNDRRNEDPTEPDYGVYRAVIDGLDPDSFVFYGVYGCTGLYRALY